MHLLKYKHIEPRYSHRAEVAPDDGKPVTFRWHWPRGTFDKRMSAYELASFVLPHMGAIVGMGLLKHHPRVEAEFRAMLTQLATQPKAVLDRLLPWIKPVVRNEQDDIIEMAITATAPQATGPAYSYGGQHCHS